MTYLKKRYKFIDVLMLISILFIGSDIWGVNLGWLNIRVIQLYYVFVFICILIENKLRFVFPKSLCLFVIFYVLSFLFSINKSVSLPYVVFLIYNVLILGGVFYSYICCYGTERFVDVFRYSLFIITICSVISFVLGTFFGIYIPFFRYQTYMGIVRIALWFYEPSYLATFLMLYYGFAIYNLFVNEDKHYVADVIMSIICLITTTSTTGFVGLAIGFIIAFCIKLVMTKSIKKISIFIKCTIVAVVIFLIIKFVFTDIYDTFVTRFFTQSLSTSSGGRTNTFADDFNVFLSNPLFGVGPDCYGLYLYNNADRVPSNVTLELLETTGIFATVAFYVFLLAPVRYMKGNKLLQASMFTMILFLIILQANQGYMRLYMWMWAYANYAFANIESKENLGLSCKRVKSYNLRITA